MSDNTPQDQTQIQEIYPLLKRLNVFVGEWEITTKQFPDSHGRTKFAWLEGGAFLLQHTRIDHPSFPRSIAVIGLDDTKEEYTMLYYDTRGVARVYQMSLKNETWQIWRDAPGFSQRFTGTFSEDGRIITAFWEKSFDGYNWEFDFDLTYRKVKAGQK